MSARDDDAVGLDPASAYDITMGPETVHDDDVVADDFYLEALLRAVVGSDTPGNEGAFKITLSLSGSVVTGTVIGTRAWERLWTDSMRESAPALAEALSDLLTQFGQEDDVRSFMREVDDQPDPAFRYLTLRDVTMWSGSTTTQLPLWRCKLSAVDGWSQGELSPRLRQDG
ncbi:hypothetical protein [Angustibacter aerolatus]